MKMPARISIILTSYNHAKYLRESINSILNQTFTDFELTIWDDASTDESWEIIRSFSDPRIRSYQSQSQNVVKNIRTGIENTQSEYIAIHHSDDIWEPQKLEKQIAFLDANLDIGAVFTGVKLIDDDGSPLEDKNHPYYKIFDQPNRTRFEWLNRFFYVGNALCHPSVLIRRACYEECGLYRYGLAQLPDFDMWVRLCLKYEIHILPEKLVRFRVRSNEANTSGNRPEMRVRSQFEFLQVYSNYLSITDKDEFLKVFPASSIYLHQKDFDISFALAMISLSSSQPFGKLFGLQLLFNLINDPERAKKIEEVYGFGQRDFIQLTAKHDIFAIELAQGRLQALEMQMQEIRISKSWQAAMLLRRIRLWLVPNDSWRERALKDLYHGFVALPRVSKRLGHEVMRRISFQGFSAYYYHKWMMGNEPDQKRLAQQSDLACQFPVQPLISIITPVYHPPLDVFRQTIDSVLEQTYPNWELCVANASTGNLPIKDLLSKYAESDGRIRIVDLDENLGIAGNTNAGILISRGDYVAFLDHDDILPPFALFEIVSQINHNPEADVFYSDEDKVDGNGKRFAPFFKPGYNPDLLQSVNYMCHFLVIRRSLGDHISWLRPGFEGAQDFDFVLRLVEKTKQIVRIPKILYHWRAIEGSTAADAAHKPQAVLSGTRALEEHLLRIGSDGTAENGMFPTFYRTNYKLKERPLVSIIIPNHNHAEDLSHCIHSILNKSSYRRYEILIVENNSAPETRTLYQDLHKNDERIRVIEWNEAFNYSMVNNWAVTQANGEVLLFLNNDIEVINADWLEQMLMHALRPEIGIVGAKLCYPDDTIQHAGIILGMRGVAGHGHKRFPRTSPGYFGQLVQVRNVLAVTAACAMVRRPVFEEVKGFDTNYILAFGDVDLCLKIYERGYLNLWTPFAELYHHESKTRGYEDTSSKQLRFDREVMYFKQKWAHQLKEGDPYYNPNLSLQHEDYRLDFQKHGN